MRKGVERTLGNARRAQESRESEGMYNQTDFIYVFWVRHERLSLERQRVVGQRFLIGPIGPRDVISL